MEALTLNSIGKHCESLVVIIPAGSLEYHGGRLPLGTDTIIAYEAAKHCASMRKEECIVILPPIPYGYSHEWLRYGDTVSLEPRIYMDLIDNLVSSVANTWGKSRTRIINGHGGNKGIIEAVVRKHAGLDRDIRLVDIWSIAKEHGLEYCHACGFEARLLSYLTGREYTGIDEEVSPSARFMPGRRGEIRMEPREFLDIICGELLD